MDDLDIADDIMALCNDHRKNCYTAEGGMQLNASNIRVISALIPGQKRQALLKEVERSGDCNYFFALKKSLTHEEHYV